MTRRIRSIPAPSLALLAGLLLAACGDDPPTGPIAELPRSLTPAEQEIIGASNGFAFDLFRQINAEAPGENVFLSPLSASMALGMTTNGARGETFAAMRDVLGFSGLAQPEINASCRSLMALLRGLDPGVEMRIGNSIWYDDVFPFHREFLDATRHYFDAEVAGLDFTDGASSAGRVNRWVRDRTGGKIESIATPDDFSDAVMLLVNATYFKGDWTRQFRKEDTRDAPFFDAGGARVATTVKMMNRKGPILHMRGDGFEAADLPYGRGAFSMTVLLPDPGRTPAELAASLDPARWREITGAMREADLEVHLPRFRLEYERSFNNALEALGMGLAFRRGGTPDFTGMSPRGRELFIRKVFQKTFVDVNEAGTEAAAVTKVVVGPTSVPPAFVANRPFLFAIRERFSGTILFIGKMEVPPAR